MREKHAGWRRQPSRFSAIAVLTVCFAGCAATTRMPPSPPPVPAKPPQLASLSISPYPMLKARIDSLIADSLFPPCNAGIKIVSLSRGETLYDLNSAMTFNPASNQKLFTAATALSRLGEGYRFANIIAIDTVTRSIYVKACGDPLLSTEDLDSLSRIVAMKVPVGQSWAVVGDMSYFDDLSWGPGWAWDEEPEAYGMFVTPFVLNSNTITVRVQPSRNPGEPLAVSTTPATEYTVIENRGLTVGDSIRKPLTVSRKWRERSNVITVDGEMLPRDSNSAHALSVWQPERYALTVFAEQLRQKGLQVRSISEDSLSPRAREITRYEHRLDSVVTFLNKESDNLSGESILKTLAAEARGRPGTFEAGASVVKEFLSTIGTDTNTINVVDGSGLSRYNLSTPAVVITLLRAMHVSQHFEAFYHSLPVAGVDGTIAKRMKGTAAEGNLRAKTGTLSGVTALSGYVRTVEGELLAFSMMMQHYVGSARQYRRVQDRIGVLLSELRRGSL